MLLKSYIKIRGPDDDQFCLSNKIKVLMVLISFQIFSLGTENCSTDPSKVLLGPVFNSNIIFPQSCQIKRHNFSFSSACLGHRFFFLFTLKKINTKSPLLKIPNSSVHATNIGNKPCTQKVRCSAFTCNVISIILSYIYIVSICIGYVIKENVIVKNDIKCLFEGKTRRCLMGSTVSRACVGLAEITMRPTKSNNPKTST